VGYVVAGVPGVEESGVVQLHGAAFGVLEAALELGLVHGLKEHDPAGVNAFDDFERPLWGSGAVGQLGEGLFVVAGDDGPVFGEGFAETVEGGGVGVGDVVDELADGPAAVAVGSVDLGLVEVADRLAELLGHLSESEDGVADVFGRDGVGWSELADGIARVL